MRGRELEILEVGSRVSDEIEWGDSLFRIVSIKFNMQVWRKKAEELILLVEQGKIKGPKPYKDGSPRDLKFCAYVTAIEWFEEKWGMKAG